MSFDYDPQDQANISGSDFAQMCDEMKALRARVAELEDQLAEKDKLLLLAKEALEKFIDSHEECSDADEYTAQMVSMDDYHEAQEALAAINDSKLVEGLVICDAKPTGVVTKHTGSLRDMAIIVWHQDQPAEGTELYAARRTDK